MEVLEEEEEEEEKEGERKRRRRREGGGGSGSKGNKELISKYTHACYLGLSGSHLVCVQ